MDVPVTLPSPSAKIVTVKAGDAEGLRRKIQATLDAVPNADPPWFLLGIHPAGAGAGGDWSVLLEIDHLDSGGAPGTAGPFPFTGAPPQQVALTETPLVIPAGPSSQVIVGFAPALGPVLVPNGSYVLSDVAIDSSLALRDAQGFDGPIDVYVSRTFGGPPTALEETRTSLVSGPHEPVAAFQSDQIVTDLGPSYPVGTNAPFVLATVPFNITNPGQRVLLESTAYLRVVMTGNVDDQIRFSLFIDGVLVQPQAYEDSRATTAVGLSERLDQAFAIDAFALGLAAGPHVATLVVNPTKPALGIPTSIEIPHACLSLTLSDSSRALDDQEIGSTTFLPGAPGSTLELRIDSDSSTPGALTVQHAVLRVLPSGSFSVTLTADAETPIPLPGVFVFAVEGQETTEEAFPQPGGVPLPVSPLSLGNQLQNQIEAGIFPGGAALQLRHAGCNAGGRFLALAIGVPAPIPPG